MPDIPPHMTPLSPQGAITNLLEECRIVIPGLQALFGFQLIAVFEPPFFSLLSRGEQTAYLAALGLIALAIGFVLVPAPYHRITQPQAVSPHFLAVTSLFLSVGIFLLLMSIVIDAYLVARIILRSAAWAAVFAGVIALFLLGLWFAFPLYRRLKDAHRP